MGSVALTHASEALGSRVIARLAETGQFDRFIAVGGYHADRPEGIEIIDAPSAGPELRAALKGVDVVVSIGSAGAPSASGGEPSSRLGALRALLEASDLAGVTRLVRISTSAVYGAWPDNPVPLPEDSPVRPNPSFPWAVEQAEGERLVAEWVGARPGATAAILRPAPVVAGPDDDSLVRDLSGTRGPRPAGHSRPVQVVHVDDLASAVATAVTEHLVGPHNVSPEGWIPDEMAGSLAGAMRVALPPRLVGPLRRSVEGLDPYLTNSWVVRPDKLRAAGWTPSFTNEEAIVVSTRSTAPTVTPKRRQELALGGAAAAFFASVAAVIALALRGRRRRRAAD